MPPSFRAWQLESVSFPTDLPVSAFFHTVHSVDFHLHSALELLMVLSGSVVLFTESGEHRLEAGDVAILHSNQVHATHDIDGGNLVLALQLDPAVARHDPHFSRRRFDFNLLNRDSDNRQHLHKVRFFIARIMLETRLKRAGWQMEVEALVLQLIAYMLRKVPFQMVEIETGELSHEESRLLGPRLHKAAEYIRKNASEPITIASVAESQGLSVGYLARLFKSETGTTFGSFITHVRLRRSLELLTDKRLLPIIDVALECGFPNVKSFNVAFKRVFLCTPGEWRKARQEKIANHVKQDQAYANVNEFKAMQLLDTYLDPV